MHLISPMDFECDLKFYFLHMESNEVTVCMYFSIDYKFIFVYEASISSREVGGGSNPLREPSISGSRLREGSDI